MSLDPSRASWRGVPFLHTEKDDAFDLGDTVEEVLMRSTDPPDVLCGKRTIRSSFRDGTETSNVDPSRKSLRVSMGDASERMFYKDSGPRATGRTLSDEIELRGDEKERGERIILNDIKNHYDYLIRKDKELISVDSAKRQGADPRVYFDEAAHKDIFSNIKDHVNTAFQAYIRLFPDAESQEVDHADVLRDFINSEIKIINEIYAYQKEEDRNARQLERQRQAYVPRRGIVFAAGGAVRSNLEYIRYSEYILSALSNLLDRPEHFNSVIKAVVASTGGDFPSMYSMYASLPIY